MLEVEGKSQSFTRLPSRGGNLLDESGTALPETAIASHLGGLSIDDYRRLLCLDDETIERGGDDIAHARGDIGHLLFSASAGVADLNAVLKQERDEANGLYRKKASSTRVAELKRELKEVENRIKDSDIGATAWRKLKEALKAAETEEAEAREHRGRLLQEQAVTAALRRSLPNLGNIDQLAKEIADYDDYPKMLDFESADLISLMREQGEAEAAIKHLETEIEKAEEERSGIAVDKARMELRGKLDDIDDLRSRMMTAELDLKRRKGELDEMEADMARTALALDARHNCENSDAGEVHE